jgi:hypothetical protein
MRRLFSLIFVLAMFAASSIAEDSAVCKSASNPIVGKCFRFRGRLGMYNGGHSYWVWKVGTSHRYWVEGDLPGEGQFDWDHFYWGNFDACPTTKFRKGDAQGICVQSMGKLIRTERKN